MSEKVRAPSPVEQAQRQYPEVARTLEAFPWMSNPLSDLARHHLPSFNHSVEVLRLVDRYVKEHGEELGFDSFAAQALRGAALIHDAGKVIVPVEILDLQGRPTQDQWDILKGHALGTKDIIMGNWSGSNIDRAVLAVAMRTHEGELGNSYPRVAAKGGAGLKPRYSSPILRRLGNALKLADKASALGTRVYNKGMSKDTVHGILQNFKNHAGRPLFYSKHINSMMGYLSQVRLAA